MEMPRALQFCKPASGEAEEKGHLRHEEADKHSVTVGTVTETSVHLRLRVSFLIVKHVVPQGSASGRTA
jgi:hypothetical protein